MQGRCLCGQVEFEFEPFDNTAMNCFCSICRRSHGADYATQLIARKSSLNYLSGSDTVKAYSSSKYGFRVFCSHCGSRLFNYARGNSNYLSVALSCVSSEHNITPSANVQIASKADWVTPDNTIDSFDEFPEDINKYM